MIDDVVREFLSGPRFAALAFADDAGRPVLARALGWVEGGEGTDLTVICRTDMVPHVPALGVPFPVAVVLAHADRFEAMQLKGTARVRAATAPELAAGGALLAALGERVEAVSGVPAALYRGLAGSAGLAFDVSVDVAFRGSPGPDAGARIGGAS